MGLIEWEITRIFPATGNRSIISSNRRMPSAKVWQVTKTGLWCFEQFPSGRRLQFWAVWLCSRPEQLKRTVLGGWKTNGNTR